MSERSLIFRVHAIERMFQRGIDADDVRQALEAGEEIESYPDDKPYPSRLVLGRHESQPLHIVVADSTDADETIVITVYRPDPEQWENGVRRRNE